MLTIPPELPPNAPDPDSFAVHRIPLPASVPPYDDWEPALREPALLKPQLRPLADPLPPGPGGPTARPAPAGWPKAGPAPAGGPQWAGQFAQALAETLAGARASQQISSWTTEQARRRIRQLGPVLRAQQRPLVRRVITTEPGPGVMEMTVIVTVGRRTRALAVRLERARPGHGRPGRDEAWLCTAIEAA
jgi:Family of unknown function (DUF6459)